MSAPLHPYFLLWPRCASGRQIANCAPQNLSRCAPRHLCCAREKRREKLQVQVRKQLHNWSTGISRVESPRRGYLPSAPMTLPPHSPSSSNLFPPTITPYGARPTDRPSDHQVLWLKRSPLCALLLLLLDANSLAALALTIQHRCGGKKKMCM